MILRTRPSSRRTTCRWDLWMARSIQTPTRLTTPAQQTLLQLTNSKRRLLRLQRHPRPRPAAKCASQNGQCDVHQNDNRGSSNLTAHPTPISRATVITTVRARRLACLFPSPTHETYYAHFKHSCHLHNNTCARLCCSYEPDFQHLHQHEQPRVSTPHLRVPRKRRHLHARHCLHQRVHAQQSS